MKSIWAYISGSTSKRHKASARNTRSYSTAHWSYIVNSVFNRQGRETVVIRFNSMWPVLAYMYGPYMYVISQDEFQLSLDV